MTNLTTLDEPYSALLGDACMPNVSLGRYARHYANLHALAGTKKLAVTKAVQAMLTASEYTYIGEDYDAESHEFFAATEDLSYANRPRCSRQPTT